MVGSPFAIKTPSNFHGLDRNIPLRFWSILTLLHHAIPADFSGAFSGWDSLVLPCPSGVLLDSDLLTGKDTEEHGTHCDLIIYHPGSGH